GAEHGYNQGLGVGGQSSGHYRAAATGAEQGYKQQEAAVGLQQILPGLVITPVSVQEETPEMQAALENLQIDSPSTLTHQAPVELEATAAQEAPTKHRTRRGGRKKTGPPKQVELQE